uniref:Uncharacterized protein n=1 Tax=Plectus sambesii TaxID=2011161 RepID=A0A914XIR3_9BILA
MIVGTDSHHPPVLSFLRASASTTSASLSPPSSVRRPPLRVQQTRRPFVASRRRFADCTSWRSTDAREGARIRPYLSLALSTATCLTIDLDCLAARASTRWCSFSSVSSSSLPLPDCHRANPVTPTAARAPLLCRPAATVDAECHDLGLSARRQANELVGRISSLGRGGLIGVIIAQNRCQQVPAPRCSPGRLMSRPAAPFVGVSVSVSARGSRGSDTRAPPAASRLLLPAPPMSSGARGIGADCRNVLGAAELPSGQPTCRRVHGE